MVGQATYAYDALDRRIRVRADADGAGAGAPAATWTAYDGANPYADFGGSGAVQARHLHGPAVDMPLARTSAAGVSAWYLADRLGSVRDVANTSGAVIDHVAYDWTSASSADAVGMRRATMPRRGLRATGAPRWGKARAADQEPRERKGMLTLYRTADGPTGREFQRALEDAGLAHDVVVVAADGPDREGLPAGAEPPALVDEGQVYRDKAAVLARLEELKAMRDEWHKYGSDACYCNAAGEIE